MLTLNVMAVVV